jgi:predicted HicB family RNase H-like nuclease
MERAGALEPWYHGHMSISPPDTTEAEAPETVGMTVRFPRALHRVMRMVAYDARKSINEYINEAVQEKMDRENSHPR